MAKQVEKEKEQHALAAEMRKELARQIAARTQAEGENLTAVSNLAIYRSTSPTPCFRASYEPGLTISRSFIP